MPPSLIVGNGMKPGKVGRTNPKGRACCFFETLRACIGEFDAAEQPYERFGERSCEEKAVDQSIALRKLPKSIIRSYSISLLVS